jgi:histone acetyltransferase (RNA polymerase elongator complex component)
MDITNIEDIIKPYWFNNITSDDIEICRNFLNKYYKNDNAEHSKIKSDFIIYQRSLKCNGHFKFGCLIYIYKLGRLDGYFKDPDYKLENSLKVKNVRENSGVMVFSLFTSAYPSYTKINDDGSKTIINDFTDNKDNPGAFSCKYDCAYCPNEPNQPRSYLKGEPGVDRAIKNDYDPIKQIFNRAIQYIQQGHPVDKIEIIIQGGTWDSYSIEYRTEFVRDIYWAFNVFMSCIFYDKDNEYINNKDSVNFEGKFLRPKKNLEEEIKINETSPCRIIGLTPETRPDQINYSSIKFLRKIGATRVQIGVQHLDDNILKYIDRRCYKKHIINSIKSLKDCGFKVDCHLMLDLPAPPGYENIMPEVDTKMLYEFNSDSKFKVDQIKIYPCMVTPYTKIKEWYDKGIYKPYGEVVKIDSEIYKKMNDKEKLRARLENPLYENILNFYSYVHPSIRINRIIRDIPSNRICGGTTQLGMRSEIDRDMEMMGLKANCIRSREAGNFMNRNNNNKNIILKEISFDSSDGIEYFLSWESDDKKSVLYSFLRLRLSKKSGYCNDKLVFPELENTALIRELHTYGKVQPCKDNLKYYDNNILFNQLDADKNQHKGYGKKLLKRAEEIAMNHGYKKIAVISGVGVRQYYRNNGYITDSEIGCFQIKELKENIYYKINKYIEENLFNLLLISLPFIILLLSYIIILLLSYII